MKEFEACILTQGYKLSREHLLAIRNWSKREMSNVPNIIQYTRTIY